MAILFNVFGVAFLGFLSACIMTLFEFPFWKKWGMEGNADWQINLVMVSKLLGIFKGSYQPRLSWVIANHLSHGVIVGIAFWLLYPLVLISGTLVLFETIAFSFLLWFLFIVLGRSIFESVGGIRITRRGIIVSLSSMIIYGFFLGLLLFFTFI